jgi:hypothetical protein
MSALTVGELEQLLAEAKNDGATDDTPVHFSYTGGDYWRTALAPKARDAMMANVEYSDYHRTTTLTDDDGEEEGELVFVIS